MPAPVLVDIMPQISLSATPIMVSHMFSMSGAFRINSFMDGYYDDNVYFNNPVDFLPGTQSPGSVEYEYCAGNFRMGHLPSGQ